jgi:hypothetical protein
MPSAIGEVVKEKMTAVVGVLALVIGVGALFPTMQTSLASISPYAPLLNFGLIATLISIGIFLFILEVFL